MKLKWEECEQMALKILDGWRVKDPTLTRRVAELILKDQKVPNIRVFWNIKKESLDFEVLK